MKFPKWLKVYGDKKFRGKCPVEDVEHINFVSWIRFNYPSIGLTIIHPKNEGKKSHAQASKDKKMGLSTGASDIIIPGSPTFVCEIKRQDHTKSKWQNGQQEYLLQSLYQGSFVCVALGSDPSKLAFKDWLVALEFD